LIPGADDTPYTEWWRRLVATLIDYALVAAALAVLLNVLDLSTFEQDADGSFQANITLPGIALTLGLTILYFAVPTARTGRTLGKVAMGCRVVRLDGHLLDFPGALLRATVYAVFVQTCVLGVIDGLWPLWDPRRQALHDRIAGTVVVDG
jgi:uncharacterized RDD family membrane protein YckC